MNPSISNNRVRDSVKTVNGIAPDIDGEVTTPEYVQTVNGVAPTAGNVDVSATVSGVSDTDTINLSLSSGYISGDIKIDPATDTAGVVVGTQS